MDTPPLPSGYQLDAPPPPDGYTLDAPDQGKFIRSEIFPIKHNPVTGETRLAYPGFVKELAGAVKSAEETPQAYDPTTGEVHVSPEMMRAGAMGALVATPMAPEAEAATEAARVATREIPKPITRPELPTSEQLIAGGGAKMGEAQESGVMMHPRKMQALMPKVRLELMRNGYNPRIDKKARRVLKVLDDEKTNPQDFQTIQNLHEDVGTVLRSKSKKERKLGKIMREMLNEYVGNIDDKDLLLPLSQNAKMTAQEAANKFLEGRHEFAKGKAAEEIDSIIRSAERKRGQQTQAEFVNAVATKFRQLADRIDKPNAPKFYTPEVQAEINRMAEGGDDIQKILRYFGRVAPRGVISGATDILLGHFVPGGPLGVAAVGEIALRSANARARAAAENISKIIRAGSKEKLEQYTQKVGPDVAEHIAKDPAGSRSLQAWLKTPTAASTRVLAITMGRIVKRPDLVPKIQQELENMDQDNNGRPTSLTPAVNPVR